MKSIQTTQAPAAIGPYVQANLAFGRLYTSGQIAIDPATGKLVEGDITAQTAQVMANIDALLKEAGSNWDHVVKTTCFLTDMGDFDAFNAEYAKSFADVLPARSCVAVAGLPKGALVEVEVIAMLAEI
ncbi:RidA family protein [Adlercreutzia aquisgranensis]|uniref:RidA family protein n=1 Tax=Adlercreutzia aquisgranensis TaxID=2941323 RepID=UPI00203BDB1C|nr:RidA family protein [Adlercreutzia aquisgranensis]